MIRGNWKPSDKHFLFAESVKPSRKLSNVVASMFFLATYRTLCQYFQDCLITLQEGCPSNMQLLFVISLKNINSILKTRIPAQLMRHPFNIGSFSMDIPERLPLWCYSMMFFLKLWQMFLEVLSSIARAGVT